MGLSIVAHSRLVKVNVVRELDGDVVPGPGLFEAIDADTGKGVELCRVWENPAFPGRCAGIDTDAHWTYGDGESLDILNMGYGNYGRWRNKLAELAGYATARAAWANPDPAGRFYELINFSDCEGTLGPKVCAKLHKDFRDFDEKAKQVMDADDYEKYQRFTRGCELAADGGVIKFL